MSDKKYHFLAACEILYRKRNIENTRRLNSLLVLDSPEINQHIIGHIQQITQIRFFRSVEAPSPEILIDDVFIHNIIPLGLMTEAEFSFKPDANAEAVQKIIREAVASAPAPETAPLEAEAPIPVAEEPTDAPVAPETDISDCGQLGHIAGPDGLCRRCGLAMSIE